mgnify:CR=1 FL=1
MRQWDAFSTMHPTFHFVPVSNMSLCHNPLLTTHSSSLAAHCPKYVSYVLLYNKTRKPQADGHAELVSASVRSQGLVKARSEILKQVQDDIWRYLLLLTHFGAANSILVSNLKLATHRSLLVAQCQILLLLSINCILVSK